MTRGYRYLALFSWVILAYFLLTSQYFYQNSVGGRTHCPSSPFLLNNNTQIVQQLLTSKLAGSVKSNLGPMPMDPVAKWFSVITNATSKLFNLRTGQDLPKFRKRAVKNERQFLEEEMRDFNFPSNKIVRYEEMAGSIYSATKKILKFFRMQYHRQVQRYLDTHTSSNIGGVYSTFRDTKSAPFHWIQDLSSNFTFLETYTKFCWEAMALWGYEVVESSEQLNRFNPVLNAP